MREGDYIRVIDTYMGHTTRWGGMEGRIINMKPTTGTGGGQRPKRGHLIGVRHISTGRTFYPPSEHCEVISYEDVQKDLPESGNSWRPSNTWGGSSAPSGRRRG